MKLKLKQPNFEHEWRDALRFREFEEMGEDKWIKFAKENHEVIDYNDIKDTLKNINLNFEKLADDKKKNFHDHFQKGEMEMPMAVKFNDGDIKLIGGNTRLAGLLKKGGNPKIWLITFDEKLKGGLADGLTLDDIAEKHGVSLPDLKKTV